MTDQQRFDTIRALGNNHIYTPNFDRLVNRGLTFTNACSTCPVCVPARYTIRTGCEPFTTRIFSNRSSDIVPGQAETMEGRCGPYLARTMKNRGYRTFGIGKFHSRPKYEDLGYEVHLHSEEGYGSPQDRMKDAYASWIANKHPEFDYLEALMGERTEMYYMPQRSPLPAELTVENWAADRAVEQINADDERPYFGLVSFIGPHPPLAPPIPFNRMYDPDRMPNPVKGDIEVDHMDEQIPWMNKKIWAEDINDFLARILKSRYYGEITYIDQCLGKILDAVQARPDSDNTLICFFTDHGDHMGDHHAWQKESFFEQACRIPFLLSWPDKLPSNQTTDTLACLTDLFAIATHASGKTEIRDGCDILGVLTEKKKEREFVTGYYGEPGTPHCKIMIRDKKWKYIFLANGGREQLFNLTKDPQELVNLAQQRTDVRDRMREAAISSCSVPGAADALENGCLREFPYKDRERKRIYQFDGSRGVRGFPENPEDVFKDFRNRTIESK